MPLRSSRKNTRNRVRVFENRSPYDPDKAQRSFQKFKNRFSEVAGKIPPDPGGRPGGRLGSRPPPQVDWGVDPRVDLGIDLPGRAQVTGVH